MESLSSQKKIEFLKAKIREAYNLFADPETGDLKEK